MTHKLRSTVPVVLTGEAPAAKLHDATILLCTHDMIEAEMLADRVGLLDRGQLLFLEPVDEVKERFGVETLEEAFFAATGRSFEEEQSDEDKDREVGAAHVAQ